MRYIAGQAYYTVSEVAEAVGVSAQTVRVWERLGKVHARRSRGGHRLFDESSLQAARQNAAQRQPKPQPTGTADPLAEWELTATGARLRALREAAGLTQKQLSEKINVSRSLLSAVERGETGVSMTVFSKIADALDLPMSELAPPTLVSQVVVTSDQRPRTALGNGVVWEELASAGHTMAPAIMYAAAGASSGGSILNSRETWFMVLNGTLHLAVASVGEAELVLTNGDSLMMKAGQMYSWRNADDIQASVLVVERQHPGK